MCRMPENICEIPAVMPTTRPGLILEHVYKQLPKAPERMPALMPTTRPNLIERMHMVMPKMSLS